MNTDMNEVTNPSIVKSLKNDFLASIVVFLVALPLCMGIAIASGVDPAKGLITGIIGGLVVGLLAGAPLQVSGPAAGLTVIVYDTIQEHGIEMLGIIVLIAGIIQLGAGLLRLGQWFRAVSPAVIHGMLAGIGVLIFASQFHVMVDDQPRGSGLQNLITIPEAIWKGVVPSDQTEAAHHWAALIGLLTIVSIVAWKTAAPKRLQVVPAPLVGVVLATAVAGLTGLGEQIKLVTIPASLGSTIEWPTLATIRGAIDSDVLMSAAAIAFIASAETLLCATAVDQMHRGPRCKYDRELTAQGIGNSLCGLVGALPMTGVIVRSSANVEAGAKTRSSAVLHGAWLLLCVMMLPWLLSMIPMACLGALLVYTGYKLVNLKIVKTLARYGRGEVAIYLVTVLTIVAADLLTGVVIGIGLAALKLLYTFSYLDIRVEDRPQENTMDIRLVGTATFVKLPKLAAALEQVPRGRQLRVHLENLSYIDHACLDLLMSWEKQHEAMGGSLAIDWDDLTARVRGPALNGASAPDSDNQRQMQEMAYETVPAPDGRPGQG